MGGKRVRVFRNNRKGHMDKITGEGGGGGMGRKCRQLQLNKKNKRVERKRRKKSMVHLHNGTLHSRKKGAPTFCNSMDGTGEHYAK